ncbi:hypothetical protein [Helicobacter winghamensis]|uniref:hypothetical protein n=1 Tax=Helicobacter winghamensis TaxID=157268 RepID=UPI0001A27CDB|nr:hypothetical protein [Helicobacter winghamensis]EEO25885.1 hypothetical protein HWAG_00677 [Helicobacter winghamensis ATCC BAA-430]
MDLKKIAHKVAKDCGFLEDLEILEAIYTKKDYREFLDLLRVNGGFNLDCVEVENRFSSVFRRFRSFFMRWVENESFEIGRESSLSFLQKDLKVSFYDFLDNIKEVKEKIVQAFIYSTSSSLYDYFSERKELKEFL